jgi:hypothetical protein
MKTYPCSVVGWACRQTTLSATDPSITHTHTHTWSTQLLLQFVMGWLPMCKVEIMEDFRWLSSMLHNFHPLIWSEKTQHMLCYVWVSAKNWMTKKTRGMNAVNETHVWLSMPDKQPFLPLTHPSHTPDRSNFCYNLLWAGFPCAKWELWEDFC